MGFLQNVGIASQASDAFDDQRQSRRMMDQREQAGQNALNDDAMFRKIVQLAYDHELAKEEAAKVAMKQAKLRGAAPIAPVAPAAIAVNAPPGIQPYTAQELDPRNTLMADGGEVAPEKFSGVYDDFKSNGKVPKIFQEWHAAPSSGVHLGSIVNDIVSHTNALANGGEITNGVGTVQNFANGGEVGKKHKSLWHFVKSTMKPKKEGAVDTTKMKKGGAVKGPGTGTSDSVKAVGPGNAPFRLSNGEYVLSADTVAAVGKHNLDALQAKYHKPVR